MSTTPSDRAGDQTPQPTTNPSGNQQQDKWQERIQDYVRQALDDPDALAAILGATNAAMIGLNYQIMEAVRAALAKAANPLEDVPNLLPAFKTCSQATREIHRLAQVDRRLRSPGTNGTPSAS